MILGEKIKEMRKKTGMTVDQLSAITGIPRATLYRYENSATQKIPVAAIETISKAFNTTPAELMSGGENEEETVALPATFNNPQDALAFILKMPTLAAYGGYDLSKMDDATILEFANEILAQIRLVSYKYK